MKMINKNGMTLVELMVGIIVLSIFMLGVGMMLISSGRFWNDGWDQVNAQEVASYAFERIGKVVRGGSIAEELDEGSGLKVTADETTYIFQVSENNVLQLIKGAGEPENITTGSGDTIFVNGVQITTAPRVTVQMIYFSVSDLVSGSIVLVKLELACGNSTAKFRTRIFMRNSL